MQSTVSAPVPTTKTTRSASLRPLPQRQSAPPTRRTPNGDIAAEELDLIVGMLDGDATAWRQFTTRYSGVVIGCIRRVLGRFSRVTCEHDVDEVYARFCCDLLARDKRKLRAYDPGRGTRLSTWVGMLASNATYDYLRRIKRDSVCDPLPESDQFRAEQASPFDEAVARERANIALRVLSDLSERDQLFVRLYFGEGLEVAEIAEQMGISEKTVYTKKHKITAKLEKLLRASHAA